MAEFSITKASFPLTSALLLEQEPIAAVNVDDIDGACVPAPARQPPAQKEELENEVELQKEILQTTYSWSRLDTLKLIELSIKSMSTYCAVLNTKRRLCGRLFPEKCTMRDTM